MADHRHPRRPLHTGDEAASARVSRGRGSPRVLRRSAVTSLVAEMLIRSSRPK
jgi:hypothetical protein